MLPRYFYFCLQHDFIDVDVQVKSLMYNFFLFAHVKCHHHIEQFSQIRDNKRVSFLDNGKQLLDHLQVGAFGQSLDQNFSIHYIKIIEKTNIFDMHE
jgi:hypothetical protein